MSIICLYCIYCFLFIIACGCFQRIQINRLLKLRGVDGVRFDGEWGIGMNYFFFGKIHIPYHTYMKNNGYFCNL